MSYFYIQKLFSFSVSRMNIYLFVWHVSTLMPSVTNFSFHIVKVFSHAHTTVLKHMSLVMRKPDFCICENKDADQLRGNREADQRLCFRYSDSTIPLLPNCEISSLQPSSVAVQPGLCRTRSETPKTGFLRTRLI